MHQAQHQLKILHYSNYLAIKIVNWDLSPQAKGGYKEPLELDKLMSLNENTLLLFSTKLSLKCCILENIQAQRQMNEQNNKYRQFI